MLKRLLSIAWCVSIFGAPALGAPIFDYGSDWKYFTGTIEASSPDTTEWRNRTFNDSGWLGGPTPTGYANPPGSPSEFSLVTLLPSSTEGGYLSVFFRKKFSVINPAGVGQLTLNINVDDGFIAWINGQFVGSYNPPLDDPPTIASLAQATVEPTLISVPVTNNLAALLVGGENTIAVQVFNASSGSSDLFFDAALESDLDETAPTVIDITPPAGSVVTQSQSIEVVFSENVQGVDATDLLINNVPASSLTTASPRDYVFNFPALAAGVVNVHWADNHNIRDLSPAQNRFVGGTWTYEVDSSGPPPSISISEFLADNERGIRDDFGQRSDWIELRNSGTQTVNLGGWFLTDSSDDPTAWRIPSFPLGANGYLIIWASGRNRTNPAAQLHTSFKLAKEPSYLALVDPQTNIVSEFAPRYPTQRSDVSYGRDPSNPSLKGFFNVPTPGARNSSTGSGFAPEPVFSLNEGVYTNASISVTLSAPSGQIRYTLNGAAPTASSPLYSSPITLTTSGTIKACVFQAGLLPSVVVSKAYFLVDATVANFSSKLPVMIISTSGQGILDHPPAGSERTFASIAAIDTFRGMSSPMATPDYLGQGGISVRGQTSSGFPKRPYRLELQDAYGEDRDHNLLGVSDGSDWILNNPYSDKPFLQNFLAYELFEKMGHYSVRRRFVEVFLNTGGGKVAYPRDYVGIYLLLEKIKVGDDRVPIQPLTPYDNAEPNISGGYMFKKDKNSSGDLDFFTSGGDGFASQWLKIHEPSPRDISSQQFDWLQNYISRFEQALYAPDWKTRTGTNHYSAFIDLDSFVDQHWIVEFAKQIDGYRLSNYFSKDRNGKIKMEPIWDYNLSFGNADYLEGGNSSGWYWALLDDSDHIWLRRLMCGTPFSGGTAGDPDFNQLIADRWSVLRTNVLNSTNVLARVDEMAALLSEAAVRDFQKWPRLGTYVWPNPSMYVTPTTYAGIITAMKNWIRGRYNWINSQFPAAPSLSLPEGRIPSGASLTIRTGANIYYTLDGTDPRLPGGGISPTASLYSAPITLTKNARVFARLRASATRWSGPAVASYVLQAPSLVISEIMYHPGEPPSFSTFDEEEFEYLEFKNAGISPIELKGFAITEGVSFSFPSYSLAPGARALVVKNRAAFEERYGTGFPILGEYIGQLDNAGEQIVVKGPLGEPILDFTYNDAWQPISDGAGFALVLADETLAASELNHPGAWRSGSVHLGTPGAVEPPPAQVPHVVISEALTRPQGSSVASVEVQNLSSNSVDILGWFFTDEFDQPKKYRVPTSTVIQPGGFVLFSGNDFRSVNADMPFILNPLGEELYLFSGDARTNLTGYVHGFQYGVQKTNDTFGRHVTSTGAEYFVPLQSSTLPGSNSPPAIPPLIINEICYNPPQVFANGVYWNNTEDEYIELYNRSDIVLQLFDPLHTTNSWKIGGAEFTFPAGTTVPPYGYLIVFNFNPVLETNKLAEFRRKFPFPAATQIFGPYGGNLDNGGETISIMAPDGPLQDGSVPYITLEEVDYDNNLPWSPGADGNGFSLSRLDLAAFANDPANWVAARRTPGDTNATPAGPVILQQPASQIAASPQLVRLNVVAAGQNLRYQWRFNGENMFNEHDPLLNIVNSQPSQSGPYTVVVMNSEGSTISQPAYITIGGDFDRDGVDSDWEIDHGLNPFDAADAAADLDSDGASNLNEYIAGTEPGDPASHLAVEQISVGAQTTISFPAAANRTYTVQYTDTLSPPNWQKLADVFGQEGFNATVKDPSNGSGRYYRLVSPAQP